MNGQLDLSFSYQGGLEVDELPVVVDLVDDSLETAVKPRLVQLASGWRQDVEPGTYLVRVRFPSGIEIRRTCAVREGAHIPISVDVRGLAESVSLEQPGGLPTAVRDENMARLADTSFAFAWAQRWKGDASREWQPIDFDGVLVISDEIAVRYRFASLPESNVLQLGGPRIAWRFVTLPAAPVVDVAVSPHGENDLAVQVLTGSAEAEALLGHLRTGAVEGADVTADSLLRLGPHDPSAAAIGGYYLLRTANLDRLSSWGPTASERFPWLADGAIIDGWQHIHAGREHRGDPDRHFAAARRQLIQATRRGVPVYTEGLRLLVDGLRLLREDVKAEDAELDGALSFIEPFAIAADRSATTVTYDGADPASPDRHHRYGTPEDRERLILVLEHAIAYDQAIDSGHAAPAPMAAFNLGLLLARQGDPDGARRAYQQAIDSGHADRAPKAAFNLGLLLARQGDPDGARRAYQQAIDSGHADAAPKASVDLGVLLDELGDVAGAQRAYQQAIDSGHADAAPTAAFNLGILLEQYGDVRGARRAYSQAIKSGHADAAPKASVDLGVLLDELGDVEGAQRAYQQAIDSGHADAAPTAAFNLGILLEQHGDVRGARRAYRQAIKSGHADAALKANINLALLGRIRQMGEDRQATQVYHWDVS